MPKVCRRHKCCIILNCIILEFFKFSRLGNVSAKEDTFDSEALAREVEKIIESEDKVEEMTKLEKRERVRRLSEGLDDDEDESDESTDEAKYAAFFIQGSYSNESTAHC